MKPMDKRRERIKRRRQRKRERRGKMVADAFGLRILRSIIVPASPMDGN